MNGTERYLRGRNSSLATVSGGHRRPASRPKEPMSSPVRPAAAALAAFALVNALPAAAHASPTQASIMQDDDELVYRDDATRDRALQRMKALGVDVVRATVLWRNVGQRLSRKAARRRNLRNPRSYGTRV